MSSSKRQRICIEAIQVAPEPHSLPCVAYFPSGRPGAVESSSFELYAKSGSRPSAAVAHVVVARKVSTLLAETTHDI